MNDDVKDNVLFPGTTSMINYLSNHRYGNITESPYRQRNMKYLGTKRKTLIAREVPPRVQTQSPELSNLTLRTHTCARNDAVLSSMLFVERISQSLFH